MNITLSSFLSWSKSDFVKSGFMAVGGAVFAVIQTWVLNGIFTWDFTTLWHTAYKAAVIYLAVKFFTPAPAIVQINPAKTDVVDVNTKKIIA